MVRRDNHPRDVRDQHRSNRVNLDRKVSTGEREELISTKNLQKEANNLLERKIFRMMRKYYKSTFEGFAEPFNFKKLIRNDLTPDDLDSLIINFLKQELGVLIGCLDDNLLTLMMLCVKRIILADRSNKFYPATIGIDFSTTKNLFHKYSSKALYNFISIPTNSILLVHFYLKQGKDLIFAQNDVDQHKLFEKMVGLLSVAFTYLPPQFHSIYSEKNIQIIQLIT